MLSLYKIIHYVFGETVFKTNSADFTRLASLMNERGYGFWDTSSKDGFVLFCTSVFSSEGVIKTADESSIDLQVVRNRGISFAVSGYRRRYGIFVGLFLGLFIMLYSQMFVWKLTVTGNENVSEDEIKTYLAECGVSVGAFVPDIDAKLDANRFLLLCDTVSSAAISINGTHVTVSVLEATPMPDIVDRSGFYNVVATHDGIILDLDAAEGTPEVSQGDAVFKGELLINSFIKGTNGTYRPTHARGIVYAAVEESFTTEIPLVRTSKAYTGRSETKRVFYLLGRMLPSLSGVESDYEYFDAVSSKTDLTLFGFIELPITEFKVIYNEYTLQDVPITPERAEEYARAELDDYLRQLDVEVLSCDAVVTQDEKNGVCRLTANAVVKRNIAREVKFDIERYMMSERLPIAIE